MEEDRLKQRLVGAVVLVALAVIFIPMLLSGGRNMEMPVFGSNVPDRSEKIKNIQHLDIKEMQKTQTYPLNPRKIPIAQGLPEPKIIKEPAATLLETITKASSADKEQKSQLTETVWAVQVGIFKNRTNALALKEKLRKKEIHAFVERLINKDTATYRVRVGPIASKKEADAMNAKLIKEMKLNGLVVKHP